MSKVKPPAPIYTKESEGLKLYITSEDYENFYADLLGMYSFFTDKRDFYSLPDSMTKDEISKIKFCLKESPWPTPLIPGYQIVALPSKVYTDWEDASPGLIAYIPLSLLDEEI